MVFQNSPEAPSRSIDLEETTDDEKHDDEAADQGEIGGANG